MWKYRHNLPHYFTHKKIYLDAKLLAWALLIQLKVFRCATISRRAIFSNIWYDLAPQIFEVLLLFRSYSAHLFPDFWACLVGLP